MIFQVPIVALAFAAAFSAPAAATDFSLSTDGTWHEFTVDNQIATSLGTHWIDFVDGSPLTFAFTIDAGDTGTLSVVDSGFAGDTFSITNNGTAFGQTSSVASGGVSGGIADTFDDAFSNAAYSRGVFTLGAGSYRISGGLAQSVTDSAGAALNATNGAVRLSLVSAVPEPSTYALLLAGLSAVGFVAGRRAR